MKKTVCVCLALLLGWGLMTPALAAGGEKWIALTFDDGPNTGTTVRVLEVLEENGVPATFFLVGRNITAKTEGVVLRAWRMGCEIACHSWSHGYMNSMTEEEIRGEISRSVSRISEITGEAPRYFRPPYIAVNDLMLETIDMIFISGVGCDDWKPEVSARERADRILSAARDGAIFLLHDSAGNNATVEALKILIPELKSRGFSFATLSGLFEKEGVEPRRGKIYSNVLQKGKW